MFERLENNNICQNSRSVDEMTHLSKKVMQLSECKRICVEANECVAITFWLKDNYCTLYSKFCDNPGKRTNKRDVYRKALATNQRNSVGNLRVCME